jgi:transcriptional regulator with XRE-family HTH domain
VGDKIRALREARGWTQRDLAIAMGEEDRAANMARQISVWETGHSGRQPSLDSLRRLAEAFEVSVEVLL